MGEYMEVGVNYKDNLFIPSVRCDADGKFRGVFSVHKHKPGMDGDSLVTRFKSEDRDSHQFEAFEDAKEDASNRAREWIDQHQ